MAKMTIVVRTLYLYLFAMLGLIFIAIGGVKRVDMALRATIFRQADALERLEQPPTPMFLMERGERLARDTSLTADERDRVREAIRDYEQWQERRRRVDPVVARRQRQAANSLAMILIGLPIYVYHWRLIRREAEARRRRPPPA